MTSTPSEITFIAGAAADVDLLNIASVLDQDGADEYFSRVFSYDEQREAPWTHHDVTERIKVFTLYPLPPENEYCGLCSMSDEGDVTLYSDVDPVLEKIPGAGLWSDDAEKWGYMSDLKLIGDHLYACGGAGQVYKRLGPDHWVHMDQGILQSPDVSERLLPLTIDGPDESDIYLAGSISATGLPPFVFHWNGSSWKKLELPKTAERITDIHVQSKQRIWMCGANGTLLLGNAVDGFRDLSAVEDNQLYLSMCAFQGRIYLGSNLGLFAYDPNDPTAGVRKVVTNLTPDLQDTNIVEGVDDLVLWSIGPKDIARFDGRQWERIHHPDNPPIGGATATP